MGSIVSMIMCTNGVQDSLKKIPMLCKGSKDEPAETSLIDEIGTNIQDGIQNSFGVDTSLPDGVIDCDKLVGFEAVYRVCAGMIFFYWIFMIIMIGVRNSRDPRAAIQNGFWGIKFAILIALIIAAFFIPSAPFTTVWYVFGLIAGFIFILVQLVLYIDFAFNLNESWVGKMEDASDDRDRKCWFAILLSTTFLIYAATAVGIGFLFHYYAGFYNNSTADCGLHKFFISFNMILCMVLTVCSVLPKVQEANPQAGLLQAAIISGYVMYLTWSAMASSPNRECNASITDILNGTSTDAGNQNNDPQIITGYDSQSIIGLVIFFLAVLWSSLRNSSQGDRLGIGGESVAMTEPSEPIDGGENGGQKVWDDEDEAVAYNYSFFHAMFSMATFYVMMTLTYWFNIGNIDQRDDNGRPEIDGWAPVWIKIVSSWLCVGLYIWTLIAPAVLTDRDFNF